MSKREADAGCASGPGGEDASSADAAERRARRRAERRARRLARLLEHGASACLAIDDARRIRFANRAAARLFELDRRELRGARVPEDLAGWFGDELGQAIGAARRAMCATTLVHAVPDRDAWLEVLIHPSREGASIHIRDVTGRKRAEAEIAAERDFGLQVMSTMGQGLAVTDLAGRLEFVNPCFERLVQRSGHELLGTPLLDVVEPLPSGARDELSDRRSGRASTFDGRVRQTDATLDVLITAVPRWRNGMVVGTVAVITDVTAQKAIEQTLRRSEQIVRRSIDQAADAVIIHDATGRIVQVNQLACDSLGYPREELVGKHVGEIEIEFDPSTRPDFDEAISRGDHMTLYGTQRRKDGSTFPVEVRVAEVDTGAERLRMAMCRDITERRRREECDRLVAEATRILASPGEPAEAMRQVARRAAEHAGGVVLVDLLDRSGWIVREHAVAAEASQGTLARALETSVPTLADSDGVAAVIRGADTVHGVTPSVSELVHDAVTPAVATALEGRPYAIVPIPGADERHGALTVLGAAGGAPLEAENVGAIEELGRLLGLAIDKAASYRALRMAEERYRLLFENNPHPMWVVDVETLGLLAVNDAAVADLGYTRDEFARLTIEDLTPPADLPAHLDFLTRIDDGSASIELRVRRSDGETATMEASAQDIAFEGRPARLTLLMDVSVRKRLEVDLRHSQKMDSIGRLASGIAHEINTPVQFVGDSAHFLREAFEALLALTDRYERLVQESGSDPDGRLLEALRQAAGEADLDFLRSQVPRACERTLSGVDRVAGIVRAMREFAHPGRTEHAPTDVNRLVSNALVVTRNEYKYVADVATDFGELPLVPGHAGDLGQVFLNVIVNAAHAIRAVAEGAAERGRITITTRFEDGFAVVRVADTGCGIGAEARERVFDPFFTTKPVGEGTGQGLALARAIVVDRHDGTIEFDSEEGRGTVFTIRLPSDGTTGAREAA